MLLGKLINRLRGAHSFRHHVHSVQDVLQRLPTPNAFSQASIAAVSAHARHHEVANAGQPRKRLGVGPHRLSEPTHLGNSPRDKGCLGIVPIAHSVADARCDRKHIFGRATNLNPNHVSAQVDAHPIGHKRLLNPAGLRLRGSGRHQGRRTALRNFLRMTGPRQRPNLIRRHRVQGLVEHLGHGAEGFILDPLRERHDTDLLFRMRPKGLAPGT